MTANLTMMFPMDFKTAAPPPFSAFRRMICELQQDCLSSVSSDVNRCGILGRWFVVPPPAPPRGGLACAACSSPLYAVRAKV